MKLIISEICKQKGVTLQVVADKMKVSRQSLANTLSKGNPTLETLERIAAALDVEITDLFETSKKSGASITCPKCGNTITIKVE